MVRRVFVRRADDGVSVASATHTARMLLRRAVDHAPARDGAPTVVVTYVVVRDCFPLLPARFCRAHHRTFARGPPMRRH